MLADFIQRNSSIRKSDGDVDPKPSPLLNEWAKATLMVNGSWTDALIASVDVSSFLYADTLPGFNTVGFKFVVPRFTVYRAICERLNTIDRILDASKCFLQMAGELAKETTTHRKQAEWVDGKWLYMQFQAAF